MSTGVSYLAIFMVIVRLFFPLCPDAAVRVDGTVTVDDTPAVFALDCNTAEQTMEISLSSLSTRIYHLVADAQSAVATDETGEERYTMQQLTADLGLMMVNEAGVAISWDALAQYFADGDYEDDLLAVFNWLGSMQLLLPEAELITENGETFYQLDMNASQLLTVFLNAAISLSIPSREFNALQNLNLWKALELDPVQSLRAIASLIDQLTYESADMYDSLDDSGFQLRLRWTKAERQSPMLGCAVPETLWVDLTSRQYRGTDYNTGAKRYNTVQFSLQLDSDGLQAALHENDKLLMQLRADKTGLYLDAYDNNRQVAKLSVTAPEDTLLLDAELCNNSRENYRLTARLNLTRPAFSAELKQFTVIGGQQWDHVTLFSLYTVGNELLFTLQSDDSDFIVQGSLYPENGHWLANVRAKELYYSSGILYEAHLDADTAVDDGHGLFIRWDLIAYDDTELEGRADGTLHCVYTLLTPAEDAAGAE